jgi:lethal(3)malignant brain tumor-like protein
MLLQVPFLIRVASISAVKGHQVQVSFDGWPEDLACWLDDDSPDMHPVGWCLKTGHPLEPPLSKFKILL